MTFSFFWLRFVEQNLCSHSLSILYYMHTRHRRDHGIVQCFSNILG